MPKLYVIANGTKQYGLHQPHQPQNLSVIANSAVQEDADVEKLDKQTR